MSCFLSFFLFSRKSQLVLFSGNEKKREAPPKKGIDESNPAYQTLINASKFEATQNAMSGLPPPPLAPMPDSNVGGASKMSKMKMETVPESNPAYQTILAQSKFEASQAAVPTASKMGGMSTMKTAITTSQLKSALKTAKK